MRRGVFPGAQIPAEHLADEGRGDARFNVISIPNFVVMKDGRAVRQQPGLVDHRQIAAWLTQAGA